MNKYTIQGLPFQILLMTLFMYHLFTYKPSTSLIVELVSLLGMIIFSYCLYTLYIQNKHTKELITTGVFKFTRHPMYTGLLIGDCIYWNSVNVNKEYFWHSMIGFVVSMAITAYLQERETLDRFGQKAKQYYSKTPRLFILYPFRNLFVL